MARITVEDCLEHIPNRFALVLVAAQRTKDLLKNAKSTISDDRENKQVAMSLREVAAGHIAADNKDYEEDKLFFAGARPFRKDLTPMVDEDLPPEF